jgi:hypothetical protein
MSFELLIGVGALLASGSILTSNKKLDKASEEEIKQEIALIESSNDHFRELNISLRYRTQDPHTVELIQENSENIARNNQAIKLLREKLEE